MKSWYQSKTLWFNSLAFIVAIAAAFGFSGELPANLEVYVLPVVAAINFGLRFITNQGIGAAE
jgi:uncharacterized membrane protein